jgi:hypothetical protein
MTGSLRTALTEGTSPGLQPTLQLIVSDAVRLADQMDGQVARQRAADDMRAMAAAVGASGSPAAGFSGDREEA